MPDSLRERAMARHRQGDLAEAEILYRQILHAAPGDFTAWHLLGIVLGQGGRNAEALAAFDAALAIQPDDAGALTNRGLALKALGRFAEALDSYDRALSHAPDHADARNNRGSVLQDMKRPAEALADYDRVLALHPDYTAAHNNRGSALLDLQRPQEALDSFDRVLVLRPGDALAHSNRGNALQALGRFAEAVESHDRALAIRPALAQAWSNRGSTLQDAKQYRAALDSFDRALSLDPGLAPARGGAAMTALNLCDWQRAAAVTVDATLPPWTLLGYSDDPALQLASALAAMRARFSPAAPWRGAPWRHDRIRLAYISSDFCQHPVATQIAQMIEHHDRDRFEVLGISTGADDGSRMRARLARGFDQFHDVRGQDAAALIRTREVDILVDLNGHTSGDNLGILHQRPAPVQATWLGYPGTTAADFVDYILADAVVARRDADFSEQVVRLPASFFVSDTGRAIGAVPTRRQAGLPEHGFVFCSFNNNWKITAPVFASWMRLLAALPGSILWLKASGDAAENLRSAAQSHGIAPDRLVFAGHVAADVHLARHALADLFLDTLPYNAHATACDALWAGLPVLTCAGNGFAARVAASLLLALGMDELVTDTPHDYEALALALAQDPPRLNALRGKLARTIKTAPLFDTPRFTRNLEAAYAQMLAIHQRGEAPRGFALDA